MHGWSIRLFRVFGIQLAVHATFFILLGYVAWEGWSSAVAEHASGLLGALISSAYLLLFFSCVVLHELGHALTARRFGVGVPRILLLPIGGMAEFDAIPKKPIREFAIAVAGPAVNVAIVAVLALFTDFPFRAFGFLVRAIFSRGDALQYMPELSLVQELMVMNALMACFNLIPVFPMDGGRVLRAGLAARLPYLTATHYAATIGKCLAATGALLAIFVYSHVQLAVLLVFIFFAADMEYRMVKRRELEDRRWREVMARLARVGASEPPRISS